MFLQKVGNSTAITITALFIFDQRGKCKHVTCKLVGTVSIANHWYGHKLQLRKLLQYQ